jgi:hypothetical protein
MGKEQNLEENLLMVCPGSFSFTQMRTCFSEALSYHFLLMGNKKLY